MNFVNTIPNRIAKYQVRRNMGKSESVDGQLTVQQIMSGYGVPQYIEVNIGVYT
jgi:hypothetical protein